MTPVIPEAGGARATVRAMTNEAHDHHHDHPHEADGFVFGHEVLRILADRGGRLRVAELKRAAVSASEPTEMECPICEEDNIVLVTYAFGDRLPASGRCITKKGEVAKLSKGRRRLAVYVVEVCPSCSWNHLAKSFALGTG